jgi:hypothetical protein
MKVNLKEYAKQIAIDYQKTVKERVDKLLELDCTNYTWLGIDSTQEERNEVKDTSRFLYGVIREIDENEGKLLLKTLDK